MLKVWFWVCIEIYITVTYNCVGAHENESWNTCRVETYYISELALLLVLLSIFVSNTLPFSFFVTDNMCPFKHYMPEGFEQFRNML